MKRTAIIIPCRNEEQHIGRCLDSLLESDCPMSCIEIVVVDGMSTDRTREIVSEYCERYTNVKMIDNPSHIKPTALNIGIKSTKSDVVMRIDAHAVYAKDYISKLVHGLFHHNADNIGGVRETYHGKTAIEKVIAVCISHSFSVGNAYWRTGTKVLRKVDTVFCGCYRRDVFNRIGFFNEKLIRTQDKELNARLINAGGVILCDPSVRCLYYPRKKLSDFLKWNFTGAKWLFYARRFTNTKMTSWKNYVPLTFFVYSFLVCIAFLCQMRTAAIVISIPLFIYLVFSLYFALALSIKKRELFYIPMMLLMFPLNHYSYGMGSLYGLIKTKIFRKNSNHE